MPAPTRIATKAPATRAKASYLFISHASADEKMVNAFVEKILNVGLGIPRAQIFSTSAKDTGPRSGSDFRKAIKEKMLKATATIQILTEAYKKSEACLNEMGAAWVLSNNVIPFVLEPIRFDNVGFIHNTTQLLKLNSAADLFKFRDDHQELTGNQKFNSANYHAQVETFIKELKEGRYRGNGHYGLYF